LKIIHISDLHIGHTDDTAAFANTKSLTERFDIIINNIINEFEASANEYTVVITGDIFDAPPTAYSSALNIIKKLKDKNFKVLIIPGNHDFLAYDCHNNPIIDLIFYIETRFTMKQSLKSFNKSFYNNENYIYADINNLQIINNTCSIGLNSMEGQIFDLDIELGAQGKIGVPQLKRLQTILDSEVVKDKYKVVYLHHHPFAYTTGANFMHLEDAEELGEIVNGRIDALLFGHAHRSTNGTIPENQWLNWNIPRCYDAGSSTRKDGSSAIFRIIDLSQSPTNDKICNFLEEL
jgi:DNA repair exonuclease SbcCD nuclease subunit